jgi:hypothetical protein
MHLAEVGRAWCAVAEGLVWADGVAALSERVDLDRERVPVGDQASIAMFVVGAPKKRSVTPLACEDRTRVRTCRKSGSWPTYLR